MTLKEAAKEWQKYGSVLRKIIYSNKFVNIPQNYPIKRLYQLLNLFYN